MQKKAKTAAKAKTPAKVPAKKTAAVPARKPAAASISKSAAIPVIRKPAPVPVTFSKPRAEEARLSAAELKDIKKYLEKTRSEVMNRLQEKKSMDMPVAEVGDPIDQASQSLDKEVLFEVTDKDQLMLEQIEGALRRLEKNVYGVCESCRRVIPKKRLKALPFARYCINCQTSTEASSLISMVLE